MLLYDNTRFAHGTTLDLGSSISMKIAFYSTKPYDRQYFGEASHDFHHDLTYLEPRLDATTAALADGYPAVCAFVNDTLDKEVLQTLSKGGTKYISLRCAGFNNVDLDAARELGIRVVRVPAYSPYSVAEHTLGLILTLNRKIHRAHARIREHNFSLNGLVGFDLHGRTIGIVGTGEIGATFAKIMTGFGCTLLAYDPKPNPACDSLGVKFVTLDELFAQSDIISLHCPLTPQTKYLINAETIAKMKHGVMIINTSRGAVIDTRAAIDGLKSGQIGYLGIDVYEEEGHFFFCDLSDEVIDDDVLARLMTFPNVLITGHQAFFTGEALTAIAHTSLQNLADLEISGQCANTVGG